MRPPSTMPAFLSFIDEDTRLVVTHLLLSAYRGDLHSVPEVVEELSARLSFGSEQSRQAVLDVDDVQDSDILGRVQAPGGGPAARPSALVGRPLTEVERYYIEQALALTEGNREEAAKMLGIGERTLYRVIQDWKLQDRIRKGLAETNGDVAAAAKLLSMKEPVLQRKIKKWGLQDGVK